MQTEAANTHPCSWLWPRKNSRFAFRSGGPEYVGTNARIESFWSTLKTEYYDRHVFDTHAEAIHGVTDWIETFYNRRRRHSALGYVSPVTFENHPATAAQNAA